jgi:hypothetical protein
MMLALRIAQSRRRVRHAGRLIREGQALMDAGRRILTREERLWGLVSPAPSWRVPDTGQIDSIRGEFARFALAAGLLIVAVGAVVLVVLG